MTRWLAALLVASLAVGCHAPRSGEQGPRSDRSVLTAAELAGYHFQSAYEAIEMLRSNWLLARGPDSFNSPSVVVVYLDHVKLGGVESLRTVHLASIARIQHFNPVDATGRWGIGHGAGAILLTTMAQPKDGEQAKPPSALAPSPRDASEFRSRTVVRFSVQ